MATSSVLQFKNSTPQSMQNKKLYDDDNKFTDDDLQDVLDGLIKLGVSNNQANKPNITTTNKPILTHQPSISPLPRPLPHLTPQHSNTSSISIHKSTSKPSSSQSHSPNRYDPAYQQEPSFIASKYTSPFAGFNLLFEAAKKVEGVSHFKIDIADIDRVTRKIDDIKNDDDLIYNQQTGIIKKKSKNGISPPVINCIDELMGIDTFCDLNDDFTPFYDKRESSFGTIQKQLRFSDMNSIGRKSSMTNYHSRSLLSSPNKLTMEEQQLENRRLSREWNNTNIKEMDKIYNDKTKLELKEDSIANTPVKAQTDANTSEELNNSSVQICQEFSESNGALVEVVNSYKQNVDKVMDEHKKTRSEPREKYNDMLMRQLDIMEHKIAKQKEKELQHEKKRQEYESNRLQEEALRKQQEDELKKKQQVEQQQMQQQRLIVEQKTQQQQQEQKQQEQKQQEQKQGFIDEKAEWYPHMRELEQVSLHYKNMYKQFEQLIMMFENNNSNLQGDLEMHIGLIVRSISANQKCVFDAYKRFQKVINGKTGQKSMERQYCFIEVTRLIVTDIRIVKSSAQKFASSYFLSFVMNEYKNEYLEIFKCIFAHYCVWTIPYVGKHLRDLKIKKPDFDSMKPSIVRCVLLGYNPIKNINNVPKEKRKYLQLFTKDNNAGQVIFESENKYFTRMQHVCGLFAAFMSIRDNNQFKNPFGIDSQDCWKWIAYLLGLPKCVYPELCSILSGIIQIIGYDMLEKYPKQFPKIIKCIYYNIYPQCNESTTTRAKAKRELNLFLRECQASMKKNNGKLIINKPEESKLIAKTVGASALTNIGENSNRNPRYR